MRTELADTGLVSKGYENDTTRTCGVEREQNPTPLAQPACYSEATFMFFTIKSNVSLTDRGYLNTENKNLQAMKWCDVINLIYFLPAINDSRKLKNKYN